MTIPILLMSFGLCICAATAQAQSPALQLGGTVGRVSATIVRDDIDDAEERTGLFAGAAIVLHRAGSLIGFETGALYVPKGAATTVEGVRGTFKLDYVEVPLLMRISPHVQLRSIRPVALLGGSLGIHTRCQIESVAGNTRFSFACDDPRLAEEVDVNRLDWSVSAGIGADIPVGERVVWTPVLRYTRGLSDIDEETLGEARNRALQLGVSLRFRL